jgi:hypothetical protein
MEPATCCARNGCVSASRRAIARRPRSAPQEIVLETKQVDASNIGQFPGAGF